MTSYSFNNPKGMLDGSDKQNNTQIQKNHWLYKLCIHIIILCLLFNMVVRPDLSMFGILVIFVWIYIGNDIQKDKIVIDGVSTMMVIFFAGLYLYESYQNIIILMQMNVYDVFPWINKITTWFSGIPWTFFYTFENNCSLYILKTTFI